MIPLIAAAAASGLARAGVGAYSAMKRGKRAKSAIKSAYRVGAQRLTTTQGDDRQASLEAMNARGILSGAAPGGISPLAAAYRALPAGSAEAELRARATHGQTAAAGTLGGSLDAGQSGEFLEEQRQLWRQKRDALRNVKLETQQGVTDSVGAGLNTAVSIYGMGSMMGGGGAAGGAAGGAGAAAPAASAGTSLRGAYGVDLLDPASSLRDGTLSISQFVVPPRERR